MAEMVTLGQGEPPGPEGEELREPAWGSVI